MKNRWLAEWGIAVLSIAFVVVIFWWVTIGKKTQPWGEPLRTADKTQHITN